MLTRLYTLQLKKSKSDADERRRKSLLPWHRKDRSKSKDRGEAEYRRRKKMGQRNPSESSSVRSDMSGSRTSLNSSDIALGRRAVSKEVSDIIFLYLYVCLPIDFIILVFCI